jgi:hypothetical protein
MWSSYDHGAGDMTIGVAGGKTRHWQDHGSHQFENLLGWTSPTLALGFAEHEALIEGPLFYDREVKI